ncbi:MAG: TetM/TetW/TetO/TetS family tetracycline resistance ribosomal protection protein [Lachnospiraceae bacterium]|nr:TetM/TetW/TetO/TetS family tetracycline resistance ribosomal protection protein [Lachnospiraceae bacterium]
MRYLTLGILAHVDAGKTTLSEALLLESGMIRKAGRVDHKDAFLDTQPQEKSRGITIFSKQALIEREDLRITLLDTPGHVDLATETERVLCVLDAVILLISGSDGIQSHTRTLWELLSRYRIPVFIFFNKMDLPGADRQKLIINAAEEFGGNFLDFNEDPAGEKMQEELALCDEALTEDYLSGSGPIDDNKITELISNRKLFPCYFGSALRMEGIGRLLSGLQRYAPRSYYGEEFGAKVFKIARDEKQARLTFLKVTGGKLSVRDLIPEYNEKVSQIRLYSGAKFRTVDELSAGEVAAVTGLSLSKTGDVLGAGGTVLLAPFEQDKETEGPSPCLPLRPVLEPVLGCDVILPEGCDPAVALPKLRILEEEDPSLSITWDEEDRVIGLRLMGKVQTEILTELAAERFGLQIGFSKSRILYRETILSPVEGIGHFEPLRHYAEVHVIITPGRAGSGIELSDECMPDILEPHWRRLIMSQLSEKIFHGVLTGSQLTDVKIALASGKAHLKHTESGDFRQAAYRAVRCGLMQAESVLLEPWQELGILLPEDCVGKAMSDIERMGGEFIPDTADEAGPVRKGCRLVRGRAPLSESIDYADEVRRFTRGEGQVSLRFCGYRPCHNAKEVIESIGYDPERDISEPADSVFCSHGAGVNVSWREVRDHMHLPCVM